MPELDSMPPTAADAVDQTTPSRMRRRAGFLVVLTAVAFATIVLAVTTWDKTSNAKPARAPVSRASVSARLDRIHDAFPSKPEEKICARAFPPGEAIPVVDFAALSRFRNREPARSTLDEEIDLSSVPLTDDALEKIGEVDHIAVVKDTAVVFPRSSVGSPEPGQYEGRLVIFDRDAHPLCETRVVAWSSRYVMEPGISARAIRADFAERARNGVRDGALRLSSSLVLDL